MPGLCGFISDFLKTCSNNNFNPMQNIPGFRERRNNLQQM